MIGICTDSGSQLPPALVERFAAAGVPIEVVPLTVTIDDVDHLDDIDVCADRFDAATAASVVVAAPSSGQMAGAYDDLVAHGCSSIISVHGSTAVAGSANAARLASRSLEVPLKVIDAGDADGAAGCLVWAIAEALVAGASLDEAALVAEVALPTIGCVAMMPTDDGIDVAARVRETADRVVASGHRLRIGVGHSDGSAVDTADAVATAIIEAARRSGATVLDLVRFRLGPSAGRYAAPGVVACVMLPVT